MTDARVAGSWRDPNGYVLRADGRYFRALTPAAFDHLAALRRQGVLDLLEQEGALVPSTPVPADAGAHLRTLAPGFEHFLQLESLPLLTVPAEWTVSMLAEAGALTLRVQRRLAAAGAALQDATAHNIQFVPGAGPRFIDHGSLVPATAGPLWPPLGQFHRHFTIPLLLARHKGWELRDLFTAGLDGRTPAQALRTLGPIERWTPRWLGTVTLPARFAEREQGTPRAVAPKPTDRDVQGWMLAREERRLHDLAAFYPLGSEWSDYADACHYGDEGRAAKEAWIERQLGGQEGRWVLDLGANTGAYSRIAARAGARVVAVEGDHVAAERLWRAARASGTAIVPVVADLAAPTPGLGFRGVERAPLLERLPRGTVLALALVHHLLVSANLPLTAVRDLLADLVERDLLFEYVPPSDPMFLRITRLRHERFDWFTLAHCLAVFGERFTLVEQHPLPGSGRVLLALRRRDG